MLAAVFLCHLGNLAKLGLYVLHSAHGVWNRTIRAILNSIQYVNEITAAFSTECI